MKSLLELLFAIIVVLSACDTTPIPPAEPPEYEFSMNVEVGSQPAKIYFDNTTGLFHVFCLGKDVDFDGIKDAEDENPSWWVINKNELNNPQKKMEFDFDYMGFPFRPCFDAKDRKLYISQSGRLKEYDIDNFSLISDNSVDNLTSAISKAGDTLFLSVKHESNVYGRLNFYNIRTRKIDESLDVGLNLQQTQYFELNEKKYIAFICEGMGNRDAAISFAELSEARVKMVKSFWEIGNIANYMTIIGGRLFLIFNGSHEIWEINLNDFSVVKTFSTATSGFNGPREAVILNSYDELYVTTYNGDVRVFDTNTGALKKTYSVDSKAEGLCFYKDEMFLVCNISNSDYTANNKVSIFLEK